MELGGSKIYKFDTYINKYAICIIYYQLVHRIGINIFPTGYSLLAIPYQPIRLRDDIFSNGTRGVEQAQPCTSDLRFCESVAKTDTANMIIYVLSTHM